MTSGTQMLLHIRDLGATISWDDGFLGARASRPHSQGPMRKPNMVYTVPPNVGATLVVAQ